MKTEFRISGTIQGEIWMPYGAKAWKPIDFRPNFSTDDFTLRDMLDSLTAREGGDFSNAPKVNGILIATRRKGNRKTERIFDLSIFPSIADYVTEEIPDYAEEN